MTNNLKLTETDIKKYRQEIDEIDINEKEEILDEAFRKITKLLENQNLGKFQLLLIQEINALYNTIRTNNNLEQLVQQKIIFALRYFIKDQDDIPDDIQGIGFLDDLTVVDWIINDIKQQYSHYFQA